MALPYIVTPDYDLSHFTKIDPKFPNWQKSFVSGKDSPLFQVEHFIHSSRPTLVMSQVKFLERALGPPGNVHGGATAALIDEVMGISVWHHGDKCVTQALELRYGRMLPLHDEAIVFTEVFLDEGKTMEVHATIYGKTQAPHVSAKGIFHRLSEEQLAKLRTPLGTNPT